MTRRRPTKRQLQSLAIAKARDDYRFASATAELARTKAALACRDASERLEAWLALLEPLAARALKGR